MKYVNAKSLAALLFIATTGVVAFVGVLVGNHTLAFLGALLLLVVVGVLIVLLVPRYVRVTSAITHRLDKLAQRNSLEASRIRDEFKNVRANQDRLRRESLSRRSLERISERLARVERRTIASFEEEGLSADRRAMQIEKELQALQRKTIVDGSAVQKAVKSHVTLASRDGIQQVEALLQLSRVHQPQRIPAPATGGYALDARSLADLLDIVEVSKPDLVLELGGGTSTIWLGSMLRRSGGRLVSVDHMEHYLSITVNALKREGLSESVETRFAPLETVSVGSEEYQWYSPDALKDLNNIDLVLIDGPPKSTGEYARYPALPMILERLSDEALVILDDMHREDEQSIVDRWLTEFPQFIRIDTGVSRLAVLQKQS